MLTDVSGLILADERKIELGELSRPRAISAIPFAGRYRLIDFALSNMVNSGIGTIGVSTYNKYQSLMDHLGTGSSWDLDRKRQGLFFLPPYVNADTYGNPFSGVLAFYRDLPHRYVLISASNFVINTTFHDLLQFHHEKRADISVYYRRDGDKQSETALILDMTRTGKIKTVYDHPLHPVSNRQSLGVMLMERRLFVNLLSEAISRGEKEIDFNYFLKQCPQLNVYGLEYKAPALRIASVQDYFDATMGILDHQAREELLYSGYPIYTKVKDEAPTYYSDSCIVSNSMISDGCLIRGTVQNSMLFRGVTVGAQTKLNNSVVFQGVQIGEACELEHVIIDKDAIIRPGIKLIGQKGYPIVIGKGAVV